MASPTFLRTAAEILSDPAVQASQARERARLGMHLQDVARSSGVCYSGMGPEPRREKPIAEQIAEAFAEKARLEAFIDSPRGRFLKALLGLEEIGYHVEAYKARCAYNRGFADGGKEVSIGEIAVALDALNDVPGSDARTARGCLSELLLAVHAKRAA